ncbi:MAG TPA: dTDP-4-dehydrorhamnose reductase [Phycisphaerales bacterium]|nr:dTDP-4-dehydrorhamnose reductase [Phycisphaerales bacterium]
MADAAPLGGAEPDVLTPARPDGGGTLPEPVVLLGACGMLGRAWGRVLEARAARWHGRGGAELDITRGDHVAGLFRGPVGTIINCAAWTDVDAAEAREDEARRVNAEGVRDLARACALRGTLLVHYSTDYVFDGGATRPYRTDEPRRPVNAYGRTKAAGEEALERSGAPYLLVRTSWLYAPWGKNFVRTIARLSGEKDVLRVVDDQRGRPTSAEHLARATARMIERGARGAWHVTDGGECSWFEFASEIVRLAGRGRGCRVEPCTSSEYPRPARRPAYSVLDISGTEALLGPMPDWRTNLADVMERLEDAAPA